MKGEQEPLGGSPAGRPTDAAGQQPEGVLVLNARDKRAIAWMIEQVGFVAVQAAAAAALASGPARFPAVAL